MIKLAVRGLLPLFFCLAGHVVFSQNEFFFNHYMFNPSYYNPAWVGTENEAFIAAHHRSQWAGYDATFDPGGAPTTQLASLVIPVKGKISGFGLSLVNDRTGPLSSMQARLAISASRDFQFGKISLGIMPAINVVSINTTYRAVDSDDKLIPLGNGSQTQPNLHAGVYFNSRKNYFLGASAENILQPGFDFDTPADNTLKMNYLLLGGKEFGIARNLIFRPSVLVRTDLNTYSFELNALTEYQERMWAGLAFRRSESMSLMLGYSFLEDGKLKAGYSFDYIIKEREAKQPTSHEVFIRYDLPNLVFGGKKAVKTPRFTF